MFKLNASSFTSSVAVRDCINLYVPVGELPLELDLLNKHLHCTVGQQASQNIMAGGAC